MRERGAMDWKVLAAVTAGICAVWVAALLSLDNHSPTTADAPAAPRPTVVVAPKAPAPTVADAPPTTGDPFAGADLTNDVVLRQLASIEEKKKVERAPTRPRAPTPAADAAPRPQPDAARSRDAARLAPAARPADVPAAAPAPVTVAPASTTAADTAGTAPIQTAVAVDTPVLRAAAEPAAPATSPPAVPTAPPTIAAAERSAPPRSEPATAAPLRIASRSVPQFPSEAIRSGVQSGRVVARLTIDADGRVTETRVLSATPTGVFERESRRALSTWRYEPPGRPTTTDVELIFTRD